MLEPAVALTDYAITIESLFLAALLRRQDASAARRWFTVFFVFIGIAAALGGTVHGFVSDASTEAYAILWRATLISIGVVAVAAAMAAANSGWNRTVRDTVSGIVILGFVGYCTEVVLVSQEYRLAIIAYLPATVFLLISFLAAYFRASQHRPARMLLGAAGMVLTFVAAGVQQSRLRLAFLDHNALYHVVQAIALLSIYGGAVEIMRPKISRPADNRDRYETRL